MEAAEIILEDFVIVFCATGMAVILPIKALHKNLMVSFEILSYFSSNYFMDGMLNTAIVVFNHHAYEANSFITVTFSSSFSSIFNNNLDDKLSLLDGKEVLNQV